jgi:hypothetical protein
LNDSRKPDSETDFGVKFVFAFLGVLDALFTSTRFITGISHPQRQERPEKLKEWHVGHSHTLPSGK